MNKEELKAKIVEAALFIQKSGLVTGTSGNISARLPEGGLAVITPSGIPYESYSPEIMCLVDLRGTPIEGRFAPSSETPLHTLIYRRVERAAAIVHTHSLYATTFAVLGQPIPALGVEGLGFGEAEIPVTAAYETAGSEELAASVEALLQEHPQTNALLLRSHGLVVFAGDLDEALSLAQGVERTARIYFQARCIGKPETLSPAAIARTMANYANRKPVLPLAPAFGKNQGWAAPEAAAGAVAGAVASPPPKPAPAAGEVYEGLPFLVRPENVARFEDGRVIILDRRVYPFKRQFVTCADYQETARAIKDMVTQSMGPYTAVARGMTQAAYSVRDQKTRRQREVMTDAALVLGNARPTNNTIRYLTGDLLKTALRTIEEGGDLFRETEKAADRQVLDTYGSSQKIGAYGAAQLKDGDCVLNHCWAELTIIYTFLTALKEGKKLTALCSETRPFLQGARLTADAISELGVETRVCCDNMPGFAMSRGMINVFFSGADRVTMSGHVVNKIGTFQAALCARYFHIPYYAFTTAPDPQALTDKDVHIEDRDPEESLQCLGVRTASGNPGIKGYYPAFDVTPPELVSGIITQKGLFSPYDIAAFFR
ncbi:MAG: class II aldolase/adducin family protein [Spirochaetales bacterium]|jgi:methylthioribose-1-phosphate isomerase|nr:class II aldolase/adducin family protein [Spirochaetales bacterium]